ncbi:MAG TPA: ABC transporter ATP-binding protein [Thermoanaerobaculia bacterium]
MTFAVENVTKEYGGGTGQTAALEGVSFAARGTEFISIIGPSGCGKTTLLKIIAGLVAPTSGRVMLNGAAGEGKVRTSLVFQDHGLLPWFDVLKNVALGLKLQGIAWPEARERARHFIAQVGLERFMRHHPHELSIGMRQRVGIARAFVADTQILLLDEPFGSLDAQTKLVLQQELLRIWRQHRKLVVHVTHDIDEAILLSDRILVMSGRPGSILEEIAVPFERPRTLEVLEASVAGQIRRHIWQVLEAEVKKSLWVTT